MFLDLGTGTADLIHLLRRRPEFSESSFIGMDLSRPMLAEGERKLAGNPQKFLLLQGTASDIPLKSGSADVVMNAFVLRNIKKIMPEVLAEVYRVLSPGGKIFFLDMYVPDNILMKPLHRLYLKTVMPFIGKSLFGKNWSQDYLSETIFNFGPPSEISARLKAAGFAEVREILLNGGVAVLHSAAKKL